MSEVDWRVPLVDQSLRLDCGAAHSLAIEDSVSGVLAAKSAGLACVGMGGPETGPKLRLAGADHIIESFVSFSLRELNIFPATAPRSMVADV